MPKVIKIIYVCGAVLTALSMRLVRPWIVIRLAPLDISRIGGMYFADWHVSERIAGLHGGKYFDIFYLISLNDTICNSQWLSMWRRVLKIAGLGPLLRMTDRVSKKLPGHQAHSIPMPAPRTVGSPEKQRLKSILSNQKPNIDFTEQEEMLGRKALEQLGIPPGQPWVCFHARDSAYLNIMYPQKSWDYHDYRDSSINNYLRAAEELVHKGYFAVRMGAIVKDKLKSHHPRILDYACNGQRTDFLDIYLGAKCAFFIGSDTGITVVPEIFHRPVVYANWTPLKRISPWVLNGLVIFKKFYSRQEKRFLTFAEILNLAEPLNASNTDLIENTPEEIRDAAMEMEERVQGRWVSTAEDEQLQARFWALFGSEVLKSPDLRIGAMFLRQNKDLLNPLAREIYANTAQRP